MAIEFARVRYVSRSNGGNAVRSAAYNARTDLYCERTGERFYFAHRDGVLHHEVLLPEGADPKFTDTGILWNAAQAVEKRKDSQEAREILLALPCNPELGLDTWREMATEFATEHFVSKGVAVQIDIHDSHDGDKNIHAHILVTTRRLEGSAFALTKARDLDPPIRTMKNGARAITDDDRWGAVWRDYQNMYFERHGLELRVDEIGIVAQRHEGPIRMRTVPEAADARAALTAEENQAACRDPEQVLEAITRKNATFTELDIERVIKKHISNPAERAEIRASVLALPEVLALHERETGEFIDRYTTQTVRQEEHQVLSAAAEISRARAAIREAEALRVAEDRRLDSEQEVAFMKATGTDGFVMIEGLAGAGKSHCLTAIREAHERSGWRVVGLAPTNVAADDLRRSGFRHGSTAHLELYYQEERRHDRAPAWDRRTVVMVDEAAMMDTRIYGRLMSHAALTGAKVILAGDDRQLASIERGGMFSALKERHGSVILSKVRRQEAEWQRAASESFAAGQIGEGLRAYAEHGHVHWSADIVESRSRLLSDWDQASREHPETNRFVYASTNAEVDLLNQALREIRVKRGDVTNELEVETVRGTLQIGVGDRIQFHGNDRKAGIYNGSLATIGGIENGIVTAQTDTGRTVQFDSASFDQFGLGYAGTVYRGQGKTKTEVHALYDNVFAWNARTAYVGLTRHQSSVDLYVSRDLAHDEIALARHMERTTCEDASITWATKAEVIELEKVRAERAVETPSMPSPAEAVPATPRFPKEEVATLRQIDLADYARDALGFTVVADRDRPGRYIGVRDGTDGVERLDIRQAADGRWTFINPDKPSERGDIIDLARREGETDLRAAREAVAAWAKDRSDEMREPLNRRKQVEEKALPEIDLADPDRAAKTAAAEEERRREISGAEHEDRLDALGAEFERQEQARVARLDQEAREASQAEQRQLQDAALQRPQAHDGFIAATERSVAEARRPSDPEPPQAAWARETQPVGLPTPAQLRYTEALAQNYDPRNPYESLAQTSLAEAASYQRDRFKLDQQIAGEQDQARREALVVRRDIEHADHMSQAYDRISGLARAMGGEGHDRAAIEHKERADHFRQQGAEARRTWEERGIDDPALYPALDRGMEERRAEARAGRELETQAERTIEQEQMPARTPEERAIRQMDLPAYVAAKHGYEVTWGDEAHTKAVLKKGEEELDVTRSPQGEWSYENRANPSDRGDIIAFEANHPRADDERKRALQQAADEKVRARFEAHHEKSGTDPEERQRQAQQLEKDLEKQRLQELMREIAREIARARERTLDRGLER